MRCGLKLQNKGVSGPLSLVLFLFLFYSRDKESILMLNCCDHFIKWCHHWKKKDSWPAFSPQGLFSSCREAFTCIAWPSSAGGVYMLKLTSYLTLKWPFLTVALKAELTNLILNEHLADLVLLFPRSRINFQSQPFGWCLCALCWVALSRGRFPTNETASIYDAVTTLSQHTRAHTLPLTAYTWRSLDTCKAEVWDNEIRTPSSCSLLCPVDTLSSAMSPWGETCYTSAVNTPAFN